MNHSWTTCCRWYTVGVLIATALFLIKPVDCPAQPEKEPESRPSPFQCQASLKERVLGTRYAEVFSLHNKLNYIIVGDDDAKLQFSFKYRPLRDIPLFIAYSNLIIWDVYADSQPYQDINFNPELFYRFGGQEEGVFSLDLGYWHDSNGKDAADSRSWDRVFLRANSFFSLWGIDLYWMTSLYNSLSKGANNTDISEYLGFWETSFYATRLLGRDRENLDLELILRSGEHGRVLQRGSVTLGAKYRLQTAPRFNPYLYLQYFNGYAESMFFYNQRSEEMRFGIALFY